MRRPASLPTLLWRSCGEPEATWFLVWMPLLLLTFQGGPDPALAMVRLLAVLLVAGLLWARGRGPGGPWAERAFVAAWAGCWAAALVTLVTLSDWPGSRIGEASLLTALLVGAGWLSWAVHERHELQQTRGREPRAACPPERSLTPPAILVTWLLAALIFGFLAASDNAHWSDAPVLAIALSCFTGFQRQGLATTSTAAESASTVV